MQDGQAHTRLQGDMIRARWLAATTTRCAIVGTFSTFAPNRSSWLRGVDLIVRVVLRVAQPNSALTIRLDGCMPPPTSRSHRRICRRCSKHALCSFALFFHRALVNLRFVQLDLGHVPLDGAQPSSWCECMDLCARVKTPR
jgi:hypothetical protein